MRSALLSILVAPSLFLASFNNNKNDLPGKGRSVAAHKVNKELKKPPLKVYKDNVVTEFFNRSSGWIASDGAATVPLSDGRVLWLMGDSHINDFDKATGTMNCLFQVRNCALLQPAHDWQWQHTTTLFGNEYPGSKSLFKFNPSDKYFSWPGTGVQIKDTVYVYCSNLKKTGSGMWGFGKGGPEMWAKIKFPEMKVVSYSPLQNFGDKSFGFSMIKDERSGYVYVYGQKMIMVTSKIYVARFPMSNPNAKWTFWDGKNWNDDVMQAAAIANAPSNDVSVCKVKNKYLLLSTNLSVDCDQGKDIFVATANSPLGPFSANKTIYTIPDNINGHSPFFYGITGHPEFMNNKNELLLTYDINGYGKCVPDCVNGRSDPNIYRPRGIRVPLKLIDPSL